MEKKELDSMNSAAVENTERKEVNLPLLVVVPYLIATGFAVAGAAAAYYFNASVMPYAVLSISVYVLGVVRNFAWLKETHPEYWTDDDIFEEEEDESGKDDDAGGVVIEEVIL